MIEHRRLWLITEIKRGAVPKNKGIIHRGGRWKGPAPTREPPSVIHNQLPLQVTNGNSRAVQNRPALRLLADIQADFAASGHVWTYMDPARLQQIGWIRLLVTTADVYPAS